MDLDIEELYNYTICNQNNNRQPNRGLLGQFLQENIDAVGLNTSDSELQKRADRADQSVLFFLAGANFWEKHAKNC